MDLTGQPSNRGFQGRRPSQPECDLAPTSLRTNEPAEHERRVSRCNLPAFGHNLSALETGERAAVVHGFKYYEVRLRQSRRRPYVIARRLVKGIAIMALAMVLFALYRGGQI